MRRSTLSLKEKAPVALQTTEALSDSCFSGINRRSLPDFGTKGNPKSNLKLRPTLKLPTKATTTSHPPRPEEKANPTITAAGTPWRVIEMRKLLVKRFPKCFQGFKQPKLPLMIGIDAAVLAASPELSGRVFQDSIADYVNGSSYLTSMIEGAARVDLNGDPAGVVTAANERFAQKKIAKRARAIGGAA